MGEDWATREQTDAAQLQLLEIVDCLNRFRTWSCGRRAKRWRRTDGACADATAKARLTALAEKVEALELSLRYVGVVLAIDCNGRLIIDAVLQGMWRLSSRELKEAREQRESTRRVDLEATSNLEALRDKRLSLRRSDLWVAWACGRRGSPGVSESLAAVGARRS